MQGSEKKNRFNTNYQIKTYPIPFVSTFIQEDITIFSGFPNTLDKEQIISAAFHHHSKGELVEADKYYQLFFKRGFTDPKVFSNYGIFKKNQGNLNDAEKWTRNAIKLQPNFGEAHANLGSILKAQGKLNEAEKYLSEIIKLYPSLVVAHINLSSILKDLGRLKEAEISINRAIELKPNSSVAHSSLGIILREQGRLIEAEKSLRKSIHIQPDLADAYVNLGLILKDLGKVSEARSLWIKAIEIEPRIERNYLLLAESFYQECNYKSALKYVEGKRYGRSQSLYLGCLLSLDKERDFHQEYEKCLSTSICNAEIGAIVDHANLIYKRRYNSPFCNESINFIYFDKIFEDSFSTCDIEKLLDYIAHGKIGMRSQGILDNGVQTSGNLFSLDYPFIKSLKEVIEDKINLYKLRFKDSQEGFIKNWPKKYELRSWIISMKSGGFLKPHNHYYGWITGSFYLKVPKYTNRPKSGNIVFSYQGPQYPTKNSNFTVLEEKVETRDICIFPSSLFHHTIPFEGTEERVSFVFDLVQKM